MTFPRLLLFLILPLVILDQVTKWWIVLNLNYQEGFPVIPGFFNIVRVHNTGVAFGLGNGTEWAPIVFMLVPMIALSLISFFWRRGSFPGTGGKISAALLLAGIVGNFIDRLVQGFFLQHPEGASFWTKLSSGYVVDFLDFTLPIVNYRWPSFNVADSCICVGAVLLFIAGLREESRQTAKRKEKAKALDD
jgi:signal peptidase II